MPDQAVVDASPLIFLAKAGRLEFLQLAAPEILAPAAVAAEIQQYDADDPAVQALENTPWLKVVEVPRGLAIFGQQHHNIVPFYWLQTSAWHMTVPQHAKFHEPPETSYKTTLCCLANSCCLSRTGRWKVGATASGRGFMYHSGRKKDRLLA